MELFNLDTTNGLSWSAWCRLGNEVRKIPNGLWQVDIKKPQRTKRQNRALHLFYRQIVAELHGVGAKFKSVSILNDTIIEADWTEDLVKERIWRPVQIALLKKTSTTQLTTMQIDEVAKPIIEALTKKFGFGLLFPSQLSLQLEKDSLSNKQK